LWWQANHLHISFNTCPSYALIQNRKNISNHNCQSYAHLRTRHILTLCPQV
jgi:hypothetical protein